MTSRKKINTFHAKRIKGQIEAKRAEVEELRKELKQKEELITEQARTIEDLRKKIDQLEADASIHWQPKE